MDHFGQAKVGVADLVWTGIATQLEHGKVIGLAVQGVEDGVERGVGISVGGSAHRT
jgi:hypothetical protein